MQLAGGIAGALALSFVLGGTDSDLGATTLAEGVSPYFVGPIIGGLLAALLYRGVLKPADD